MTILLHLCPQLRRGVSPPQLSWASSTFSVFLHSNVSSLDRFRRPSPSPPLALLSSLEDHSNGIDTVVIEKKSKGQKKREALRGVDWALEFANFSDSQLRRAIRWGDLQEEVFDAVKLVKRIGRDGKHARRRQLNLIGGMLRDVDPELMASIIKAIKNGNVEGAFSKANVPADSPAEEFESDDVSSEEEDSDRNSANSTTERWLEGLLSGDSDVLSEVYSIKSANFNRQELRRLVREATKNGYGHPQKEDEDDSDSIDKPKEKLRDYLESLVKLSHEN